MDPGRQCPGSEAEPAAQLLRRGDLFEQLVYGMSDLLLLIDPDGRVAFTNHPAGRGGESTPAPGLGESLLAGLSEPDRVKLSGALEDVFAGRGRRRQVFFRRRGGGGDGRVFEGVLTPVVEAGRVVQAEFLGRDATDRIRALRALQRGREDLRRDLAVAAKIQESLLPPPLATDEVLIDLKHLPLMSVGGDYVHIDPRDPRRPVVAVLDVAGHGIASALVANRVHSAIFSLLGRGLGPPEMIRRLNRFVYRSFADLGLFVTLFVMRFDLPAGTACYCGAGHPPALLRRAGEVIKLESRYLPIGVQEDHFIDTPGAPVKIEPGDLIWIYTDGLMELRDTRDRMIGVTGMMEKLKALEAVVEPGLAARSVEHVLAGNARPDDDLTLVAAVIR